jgi:hypothetical protein
VYPGTFVAGYREGEGEYVYAQGGSYAGEWVCDRMRSVEIVGGGEVNLEDLTANNNRMRLLAEASARQGLQQGKGPRRQGPHRHVGLWPA